VAGYHLPQYSPINMVGNNTLLSYLFLWVIIILNNRSLRISFVKCSDSPFRVVG